MQSKEMKNQFIKKAFRVFFILCVLFSLKTFSQQTQVISNVNDRATVFKRSNSFKDLFFESVLVSNLGNNWKQYKEKNKLTFDSLKNGIPFGLKLPSNNNNLEFTFSYKNRELKVDYYYRILGYADNWTPFGNDGKLLLHNLPGGDYNLEVKAQLEDIVLSNILSYHFNIKKPFYQEIWFLIVMSILIITIIWLIIYRFSAFSFENFDSYGNASFLINKTRILCLAAICLTLFIDYFHSEVSHRYIVNWQTNILVIITALFLFLYTFYKNSNRKFLGIAVKLMYSFLCGIYIYRAFLNNFDPIISSEVAIIFIYAVLIFQDIKSIFLFSIFVLLGVSSSLYLSNSSIENKSLFLAATIQALITIFLFILIENKKLSKILFSDKILNNSEQFIIVMNDIGEIVFANKFMADALGFEVTDILKNGWWERREWNDEKVVNVKNELIKNIKLGISNRYNNTYLKKSDGKLIYIDWQETPIEGKYMLGIGKDVTIEVQQKAELENLSLVAKHITNGVVITDNNQKIEWVNDSFLELMGYTLADLIGKKSAEVFSAPETSSELKAKISDDKNTNEFEILHYTKSKEIKWFLVNITPIYDNQNNLLKTIEIITDITERKKLEDRHSHILNNAGDIIYTCDTNGNFNFINDSSEKILGFTPTELLGKHYTKIVHPDFRSQTQRFYLKQFIQKNNNTYLEFKVVKKNKEELWVAQTVNLIFDDFGQISGFQSVVRDINFIKNSEEINSKRQEKTNRFNSILNQLTTNPNSATLKYSEIIKNILVQAAKGLQIDRISIWKRFDDKLECEKAYTVISSEFKKGETLFANRTPIYFKALADGETIIANNICENKFTSEFCSDENNDIKSLLDLPIFTNGKLVGLICFEMTQKYKTWDSDDISFARSIANVVSISKETQKRKLAEKSIKESEANFRLLNETIDDVFWLYDIINSKILYISPSCEILLGSTADNFFNIENYWQTYILDQDRDIVLEAHQKIKIDGYYEIEYRINHSDGIRWIFEKSFGIQDDEGNYTKSSGICTDITERKKSQKIIHQLSLVAQKTKNIITISDAEDKIEWVNEAFTNLTGYTLEEVKGKYMPTLLQGKLTNKETANRIQEGIKNKINIKEEIINYSKSGNFYWLDLNINPVFDEKGELINYISVGQESTERKLKEQLISNQNFDILSSINYAKRIQNALLPSDSYLESLPLPISYYYKPKDIIGGDFYWVQQIENKIVIAIGDCTGHGVPGALMTSLGINGLINSVSEQKITDPAAILTYVDKYIYGLLSASEVDGKVNDGLDVAVICIDLESHSVQFSGGGRPLLYSKNNEMFKIDGSRKSVGTMVFKTDYETTVLNNMEGAIFYLFSDGMVDQFGGPKNKRLGSKNFSDFLGSVSQLELQQQRHNLIDFFNEWSKENPQTDDMIWLSVKI